MPYQEFQENWKQFSNLINQLSQHGEQKQSALIKRYIDQNLIILNEMFNVSIANLKTLCHAQSADDIICAQARFTNEIHQKLSLATQRFLNASLSHISDYNEWLKAHCDLATD